MILVFGQTGQVARELARQKSTPLTCLSRAQADLTDPDACAAAIRDHRPAAVINAAAFTAVDQAEAVEPLAHTVNALAPGAMARACAALHIPILHVSTDYVFDGTGTLPRRETDPTGPLNAYGRTKLAGEKAVRAAGGQHAILRTSWVFSAHGSNFVKTMLRLAETRGTLDIVDDQIGGPTPADAIAQTLLRLVPVLHAGHPGGTWHYAGAPNVSWAGFARETFAQAGRDVDVRPIATDDWPTPAVRPRNSRLDCQRLETDFGVLQPDWRAGIARVLKEITS